MRLRLRPLERVQGHVQAVKAVLSLLLVQGAKGGVQVARIRRGQIAEALRCLLRWCGKVKPQQADQLGVVLLDALEQARGAD